MLDITSSGVIPHVLDAMKMVHQFRPMAYKLAPTLYVVGENAILNWYAKKDQEFQIRCGGGVGSRSMFDHRPNLLGTEFCLWFTWIASSSRRLRGIP